MNEKGGSSTMTKGKLLSLLAGPLLFILIALIPFGTMEFGVRTALATVLWMAIWLSLIHI